MGRDGAGHQLRYLMPLGLSYELGKLGLGWLLGADAVRRSRSDFSGLFKRLSAAL